MKTKLKRRKKISMEVHEKILKRIFQYFCETLVGMLVAWTLWMLKSQHYWMLGAISICLLHIDMYQYRILKGEPYLLTKQAYYRINSKYSIKREELRLVDQRKAHAIANSKKWKMIASMLYLLIAMLDASLEIFIWAILLLATCLTIFPEYLREMEEEGVI